MNLYDYKQDSGYVQGCFEDQYSKNDTETARDETMFILTTEQLETFGGEKQAQSTT